MDRGRSKDSKGWSFFTIILSSLMMKLCSCSVYSFEVFCSIAQDYRLHISMQEGVEKFSNADDKTISWKKIMEFGATVLTHGRTAQDLKNKWARISRSPKLK